jgi:hypothetical protein
MKIRLALHFGLPLALLLSAGCSKPPLPGPPPHPVHGKVIYRGQPARGFCVVFTPLDTTWKVKFAPAAMTGENGEFRLRSYRPNDGAPKGEYAVTFQWPDHINTGNEPEPAPEVDQLQGLYSDPNKSTFKVVVHEGENELEPFVLP